MRGELRAVVTTDALELGIDIGELDGALVVTFPGTVASLRQMWGRAGRRGRGLAVYWRARTRWTSSSAAIPRSSSNDRWRPRSSTTRAPDLPLHLLAPPRGPASREDASSSGRAGRPAEALESAGDCAAAGDGGTLVPRAAGSYPAAEVSLRSASPESFAIVDVSSGELLGSTEAARAHSTVHEGAVYMHLGSSYEVRELELDDGQGAGVAVPRRLVHPAQARHRHRDRAPAGPPRDARRETVLRRGQRDRDRLAYQRRQTLRPQPLDLVARWTCPRPASRPRRCGSSCRRLRGSGRELLESTAGGAARDRARPDRGAAAAGDVRPLGHRRAVHERPPPDGNPTIFIYDGHPGGIGIARTAFTRFEELCRTPAG